MDQTTNMVKKKKRFVFKCSKCDRQWSGSTNGSQICRNCKTIVQPLREVKKNKGLAFRCWTCERQWSSSTCQSNKSQICRHCGTTVHPLGEESLRQDTRSPGGYSQMSNVPGGQMTRAGDYWQESCRQDGCPPGGYSRMSKVPDRQMTPAGYRNNWNSFHGNTNCEFTVNMNVNNCFLGNSNDNTSVVQSMTRNIPGENESGKKSDNSNNNDNVINDINGNKCDRNNNNVIKEKKKVKCDNNNSKYRIVILMIVFVGILYSFCHSFIFEPIVSILTYAIQYIKISIPIKWSSMSMNFSFPMEIKM